MTIRLLIPIILFCLPVSLHAQFNSYTEVGVLGAFTNYSGDIAESRIEPGETKIGLGLLVRHTFSRNFAFKGQVYYGEIAGDDINASAPGTQSRKFRFVSKMIESSALLEFSFLNNEHNRGGRIHGSPYFFSGFGITYADPIASYYGPDSSDPTKNPFPEPENQNIFFTIPVGIGAKVYLGERIAAFTEFGWRPVFSDLLDGISLSGNPNKKDWYVVMGIGFSYVLTQ